MTVKNNFFNKRLHGLEPYTAGEQPRGVKIIKLNTNENPYPPSPDVLGAIKQAAGEDLRLYPDPGCTIFREAVAEKYNVMAAEVFAGNGSDEVLAFAFGAFFNSKDDGGNVKPVLFPDITYSFYTVYCNLWNIPFKQIRLTDDFSINVKDYCVEPGGVVLPNPNAPTGRALCARDILSIADYQADNVVIVDEAYGAFGAESVVPFIKDRPNLLTVHTLSKSHSLAGLRAGFAIGQRDLIEGLERIRDSFNSYTVDFLAQNGAAAALRSDAYYGTVNKKIVDTRVRISAALTKTGWTVIPSSANFIFVKAPNLGGGEVFRNLRENGVLVRYFNKECTKDFVRVTIGTDDDMDVFLKICGSLT